jgi:hypothetical protein
MRWKGSDRGPTDWRRDEGLFLNFEREKPKTFVRLESRTIRAYTYARI